MLRSNKGFFLLELLLSLSALLMLSLYLLPILMEIRHQSMKLEIENTSRKIMYEELQAKLIDSQTFKNYTIIRNKVEYKIIWNETGSLGQKEVCVIVEKNAFLPESKVCGVLE
ncbi:competence type IV pilus minor pilin ComGE [Bacillus salipaludis]|uniref:Competence type IV pilus minor pilin ComGE n=1 Tax=Bacillus salipaludis TaxID=2547811 RepID=A0ABW8RIF7_9BACI